MTVAAKNAAFRKEQLSDLVLRERVPLRAYFDFPTGNDKHLAGEAPFHQLPELEGPFFIMVVGDGDAVDAPGFDLRHHLFGDFDGRRREIESFPNVSMQVEFQLQTLPLTESGFAGIGNSGHWKSRESNNPVDSGPDYSPVNFGDRFSKKDLMPSSRSAVLCKITLRSASRRSPASKGRSIPFAIASLT